MRIKISRFPSSTLLKPKNTEYSISTNLCFYSTLFFEMNTLTGTMSRDVQLLRGYGEAFEIPSAVRPRLSQISEKKIFHGEVWKHTCHSLWHPEFLQPLGAKNLSILVDITTQKGQWKLCPQHTARQMSPSSKCLLTRSRFEKLLNQNRYH